MVRIEKFSNEKHEGDIMSLVYFDNKLFSGGYDGIINVWDPDLNHLKSVNAYEGYIYAMTVSNEGKVYSSNYEGIVKYMLPPYDNVNELFHSNDVIQALYFDENILFTGDEKGVVTSWVNDKMLFKYNLVEEIKSLACEGNVIYSVRDLDVVISETIAGKSGKYSTKAVIEGKSPLCLLGPKINKKHSFLTFTDRSGKGLCLVKNLPNENFATIWKFPNLHDLIINAVCGDDRYLYSGGYDGKIKALTDLSKERPTYVGEVNVGCCINTLCCGPEFSVYVGGSDGVVRLVKFI